MISKRKQPELLPREDVSCSLVLYEAFLQRGLKEKNGETESPATKRKMTLNIQIQLRIVLFFHLKATNDLLKKKLKISVPMLETFQRECFEPPHIRISNVKLNWSSEICIISKTKVAHLLFCIKLRGL